MLLKNVVGADVSNLVNGAEVGVVNMRARSDEVLMLRVEPLDVLDRRRRLSGITPMDGRCVAPREENHFRDDRASDHNVSPATARERDAGDTDQPQWGRDATQRDGL